MQIQVKTDMSSPAIYSKPTYKYMKNASVSIRVSYARVFSLRWLSWRSIICSTVPLGIEYFIIEVLERYIFECTFWKHTPYFWSDFHKTMTKCDKNKSLHRWGRVHRHYYYVYGSNFAFIDFYVFKTRLPPNYQATKSMGPTLQTSSLPTCLYN